LLAGVAGGVQAETRKVVFGPRQGAPGSERQKAERLRDGCPPELPAASCCWELQRVHKVRGSKARGKSEPPKPTWSLMASGTFSISWICHWSSFSPAGKATQAPRGCRSRWRHAGVGLWCGRCALG
jgi:hypothetical protein